MRRDKDIELTNEEINAGIEKTEKQKGKKAITPEEKKKKKKLLLAIFIPLSIILLLVIIAALFINHKLSLINYGNGLEYTLNTDQSFVEDETINFGEIDDVTGNTYKDILKNWALTTDAPKMYDKSVLNVLLIGSDASAKEKNVPMLWKTATLML